MVPHGTLSERKTCSEALDFCAVGNEFVKFIGI